MIVTLFVCLLVSGFVCVLGCLLVCLFVPLFVCYLTMLFPCVCVCVCNDVSNALVCDSLDVWLSDCVAVCVFICLVATWYWLFVCNDVCQLCVFVSVCCVLQLNFGCFCVLLDCLID